MSNSNETLSNFMWTVKPKKNIPQIYLLNMLLRELKTINEDVEFEQDNPRNYAEFHWYLEACKMLFDMDGLVTKVRPDLLSVRGKSYSKSEKSVAVKIEEICTEIIELIHAVKEHFSNAEDDESVIDFEYLTEMILEFGRSELGELEWYSRENIIKDLTKSESDLKKIIQKLKKKRVMTAFKKRAKTVKSVEKKLKALKKEHPFPEEVVRIIGNFAPNRSSSSSSSRTRRRARSRSPARSRS